MTAEATALHALQQSLPVSTPADTQAQMSQSAATQSQFRQQACPRLQPSAQLVEGSTDLSPHELHLKPQLPASAAS